MPEADDTRPNLLVLVTDDHPFDALGAAGHPVLRTPHMDALAARGVFFTHAFVTTPICAASRASLFTGRYERSHGYTFTRPPLGEDLVRQSYPSLLRAAGYRVGLVGKLGVNITPEGRAAMFDTLVPGTYPYYPDEDDPSTARHLTERNVDRPRSLPTARATPRSGPSTGATSATRTARRSSTIIGSIPTSGPTWRTIRNTRRRSGDWRA